jgi:hypothetical protein
VVGCGGPWAWKPLAAALCASNAVAIKDRARRLMMVVTMAEGAATPRAHAFPLPGSMRAYHRNSEEE